MYALFKLSSTVYNFVEMTREEYKKMWTDSLDFLGLDENTQKWLTSSKILCIFSIGSKYYLSDVSGREDPFLGEFLLGIDPSFS